MEEQVRAHAIITGRVQGVFYRVETKRAAEAIGGITGWVKNREDGSVEGVFEGSKSKVNQLLKWCEKGPPHASVRQVDAQFGSYTGEYTEFSITY